MSFIQKVVPVGRLMCNCQILVCPQTRETVLVDPGDEPEVILKELTAIEAQIGAPLKVKALFHTHAHFDHIGGTRRVKEAMIARASSGAGACGGDPTAAAPEIFLHKADEALYQMLPQQAAMFGFPPNEPALPVDRFFEDNQELRFGAMKFSVLHTPGHSPGGVCFRMHEDSSSEVPEMVFTGDTLFRDSVGRSDFWGGDGRLLVKSIRERLYTLDGDTPAWPGHGSQTTIGHEKTSNPYTK
ncbi:MAG: MBL fold metallo-hydrolase [Bdellovibrionales bacterium]|nr:MBL fold metallo-hydrolase [Bdellovibrionales bacterium]